MSPPMICQRRIDPSCGHNDGSYAARQRPGRPDHARHRPRSSLRPDDRSFIFEKTSGIPGCAKSSEYPTVDDRHAKQCHERRNDVKAAVAYQSLFCHSCSGKTNGHEPPHDEPERSRPDSAAASYDDEDDATTMDAIAHTRPTESWPGLFLLLLSSSSLLHHDKSPSA
jgi:hypothetical protein